MVDPDFQTSVRPVEDTLDEAERAYEREIANATVRGDNDRAYVLSCGLKQYRELYKAAS